MPLIDIADLSSLVEVLKSHNPGIPFSGRTEITYRFLTSTSGPGQFNAADYDNPAISQTAPNVVAIKNAAYFRPLDPGNEQAVVRAIFAELQKVLNVTFREATGSERGDIRFGATTLGPNTAGANVRTSASAAVFLNDVFIEKSEFKRINDGFGSNAYAVFRSLVMHEIGHALGLKHSFYEPDSGKLGFLPSTLSSTLFTVMAYDDRPLGESEVIAPVSFQVLDMAVLQDIYGTSSDSSHSVDNQYAFTPDAPSASAEVQQFRTFAGQFKLIWDSGGIDTFDASAYTASKRVRLDLREGAQSSIEEDAQSSPDGKLNVSVAFNSEIEKAVGGAGNDTLIGNQLANELRGGAGADRLDGGTARFADNGGLAIGVGDGQIDTLIGCEGPDVYVIRQGVARDVVDDSGANDMLEFRDQGGLQLIGQLVGVRVAAGTDV